MRAAVIGCGLIGSRFSEDPKLQGDVVSHAEAYVRSPQTELVAVCDGEEAQLQRCAERWGVPIRCRTVEELLAVPGLEMISICTPDGTHFAIGDQALRREPPLRALLCEKPLAMKAAEAERLVALARERGTALAVGYLRRYAGNVREVQRRISRGDLGETLAVSGWYTKGTLHNGTHWFDLLRFLVGEVEWVEAWDVRHEGGVDPSLEVTLGLQNAIATLRAADARRFSLFEMDILGSKGRVRLVDGSHQIEWWAVGPSERVSGYQELRLQAWDFGHRRDMLLHAVEDLVQACQQGREPRCSGADGVQAVRIGEAAQHAAQQRSRVSIEPLQARA